MAKTKDELLAEAQTAGLVASDADPDSVTASELRDMLASAQPADEEQAAWEGSASATEPIVAPDGHVVLSQEDIDARDQ